MSKIAEELYQEGRQEGWQEGRQEGEHSRAVTTARNLLLMGMTADQVAKATDLHMEEVQKLKEELH